MRGFGLQVLGAVFGLVICMGGLPYPALAGEGWQHRLPHRHACVTLDPADSCSQIIEHAPPQARRGLRQIARAVSSLEARQPIGGQSGINTRFVNGISHGVSCGVLTNVPVMFYNNCVHAVNPKIIGSAWARRSSGPPREDASPEHRGGAAYVRIAPFSNSPVTTS